MNFLSAILLAHLSVSPDPKSGRGFADQDGGDYVPKMGQERCTLYAGLDNQATKQELEIAYGSNILVNVLKSIDYFSEFKEIEYKEMPDIEDGYFLDNFVDQYVQIARQKYSRNPLITKRCFERMKHQESILFSPIL